MNTVVPASKKSIVSPVLVGRVQELETLERALQAVQSGVGQCIVISGEAGVGKSRLLTEIRKRAEAGPFRTLLGFCFEQDRSFPYAPLVDALRTDFTGRTPPEIREMLGPFATEIVKLVPELVLSLPGLHPTPALDPEAEKRRLFEALTQFFIRLAVAQPLVLTLEDLHWSDETSLDFVQLLARRITNHPLLLIASYRREEAPRRLIRLLAQLERGHLAREITLAPLNRDEMGTVLRAVFDLPQPVKAEFLDLLVSRTEGNPFFLEEVLKSLIAAEEIYFTGRRWERKPIDELRVPRSVQDAVQGRMEMLSEIERNVLTVAAVVGRRFHFNLLQALTQTKEPNLLQAIRQLIAAQFVVEESPDQFAFRHALTREAVYMSLLHQERKARHRNVAETLENMYADALEVHAADLAYHYHAAELWTKALEYSRRAGKKAQALYAPREAIEHFTRAFESTQALSLPVPIEILRARGSAYETAGDFESARADYEAAVHAAQQAQDGAAEWQLLIDLGSLWTSREYARTNEYFRRALERARTLDDPLKIGHSLNRLGNWHANVEQPGEGIRYHQEALNLFQSRNDRRGLVETLDLLGMAHQLNSDLRQAYISYKDALAFWRELEDRRGMASSLGSLPLCAAGYLKNLDVPAIRLADAAQRGEEAVQLARDIRWLAGEAYAQLMLAMCLGSQGEYRRALDAASSSLALAEDIEHRQWIAGAHTALGVLHLDLLALDAARSHLEQALDLARVVGSQVWIGSIGGYLAFTCLAQGEFERAAAILNDVLQNDAPLQTQSQRLCWFARGKLAMARGESETALRITDGLIGSASNVVEETVIPRLWKLRGESLAALGEKRQAETVLQTAKIATLEAGARPLLWRIHVALGKLYQVQSRREDAAAEFSAVREITQSLAANVPNDDLRYTFIERVDALLPRLPTPSPRRAEKEKFGGLTVREREVAALIMRGKSNREIAEELFLGVRTVEAHITRILNKLGFSSRAQIAAWSVEKGLLGPPQDSK